MKSVSNYPTKSSQPQSAIGEHQKKEIEKVNKAIQDCKAKGISKYINVNGRTYLVTSDGVMLYEGTATVAYSQAIHCEDIPAKNQKQSLE